MLFVTIIHHYLLWHYTRAFYEIFHVWRNFLWFVIHVFSLPQLVRSWFAPFKRMTEGRGEAWNLEDLASYVIIGIISRIIGGFIRTIFIMLGILALAFVVAGGLGVFLFWVIAPVSIIVLITGGISSLFI